MGTGLARRRVYQSGNARHWIRRLAASPASKATLASGFSRSVPTQHIENIFMRTRLDQSNLPLACQSQPTRVHQSRHSERALRLRLWPPEAPTFSLAAFLEEALCADSPLRISFPKRPLGPLQKQTTTTTAKLEPFSSHEARERSARASCSTGFQRPKWAAMSTHSERRCAFRNAHTAASAS